MSVLFQFLSDSPRLQKICIDTSNEMLQDVGPDQVISLESLVELDYTCEKAVRILPCLRLPRLKRLRVDLPWWPGQMHGLADLLPYDGRLFLEGATEMKYRPHSNVQSLEFHGTTVDATINTHLARPDFVPIDWFSGAKCIPFGQIQDLTVERPPNETDFPIAAFENLEVLRISSWGAPFTEGFFRLLYPGVEVPCRSLRAIRYNRLEPLGPLIGLVKARLQAGHQLELVELSFPDESDQGSVVELRGFVGEVLVQE
jgi:hypothetical protein